MHLTLSQCESTTARRTKVRHHGGLTLGRARRSGGQGRGRTAKMPGTTTRAIEMVLDSIDDSLRIPKDGGINMRPETMRLCVEYAGLAPHD